MGCWPYVAWTATVDFPGDPPNFGAARGCKPASPVAFVYTTPRHQMPSAQIEAGNRSDRLRPSRVGMDLIFGPAMYRMAIGHAGLTPSDADAIVATAMRAVANRSVEARRPEHRSDEPNPATSDRASIAKKITLPVVSASASSVGRQHGGPARCFGPRDRTGTA